MCKYFPEKDKSITQHILRDGMVLSEKVRDQLDAAYCFRDLGIVTAIERVYVKCVNENDDDFPALGSDNCTGIIYLQDSSDGYCPECGRPINEIAKKQKFLEYKILLDLKGIEEYIYNSLCWLEITASVEKFAPFVFRVATKNDKSLKVVIPNYADVRNQSAGLFFAEPTLYIVTSPIFDPVKTVLEENQYIELSDFLSATPLILSEKIDISAIPISGRRYLAELEAQFDAMLDKRGDRYWQFFEQEFVPALALHVSQHPEMAQQYLDMLRRLSGTIFGEFYVPIGGAGKTDLRPINKFELVNQLFRGNAIGDAKCHRQGELTYDQVATINLHLDKDRTTNMAIVFVANDKITSTAWDSVLDLRNPDGTWKIIILPKYLLLELIDALDASPLLKM